MSEVSGIGERIEHSRRRRRRFIIGAAFAIGMVVGVMAGLQGGERLFDPSQGWPPAMAIGIAFSYLAAVIGGGIALSRQVDEVERDIQYKATAVGAFFYVLVYPVWFALWMGSLVPEPMHGPLFIGFWLTLFGASIFYRFR